MNSCKVVLLVCAALWIGVARSQSVDVQQLQRAIFVSLITDEDPGTTRMGARNIRTLYPTDQELTDLVAESLLNLTAAEPSAAMIDSARWHLQSLGDLRNPRYRDTIQAVRQRSNNEQLITEVEEAMLKMPGVEAAQYVAGSADVLRSRAEAQALMQKQKWASPSALRAVRVGTSLADVLQSLGAPDALSVWRIRNERLAIHYQNVGVIVLGIGSAEARYYAAAHVFPELVPVSASYKGANFARAQVLGSAWGRAIVQYYKIDRRKISADMDEMYVLVRRILERPVDNLHRYDDAMYRIALEDLWRSPDPRAMEMMRMIAAMPGDNDYKDIAIHFSNADRKRAAERASEEASDEDEGDDEDGN